MKKIWVLIHWVEGAKPSDPGAFEDELSMKRHILDIIGRHGKSYINNKNTRKTEKLEMLAALMEKAAADGTFEIGFKAWEAFQKLQPRPRNMRWECVPLVGLGRPTSAAA